MTQTTTPSRQLQRHRDAIQKVIAAHGVHNARVFGSVARGTDTPASDLDILVDPSAETSLFDLGSIRWTLQRLLGIRVDIVTPGALPEAIRAQVLAEAEPL